MTEPAGRVVEDEEAGYRQEYHHRRDVMIQMTVDGVSSRRGSYGHGFFDLKDDHICDNWKEGCDATIFRTDRELWIGEDSMSWRWQNEDHNGGTPPADL